MKILIEGEKYPIEDLERIFKSAQFYYPQGYQGIVKAVGYYHSMETNELVFMLPKVFMRDAEQTVWGISKEELCQMGERSTSIKHDEQFEWLRNLSVFFYKSLVLFKKKFPESELINYSPTYQLKGLRTTQQYSYLDILLSFVSFYKKNSGYILYKHIDAVHANPKKPKWEKTVRKGSPILIDNKTFIYDRVRTKSKAVDNEEELIIYFLSIINYFNEQHSLGLHLDKIYPIIKGKRFIELKKNGLQKLKKIKYRYFTDMLKSMHSLCMIFFSQYDQANSKVQEDFITISSYNIVFEEMVDRLFSDELEEKSVGGVTLSQLKHNRDGKVIDHLFDHTSLFDDSRIFYIGDSKYYKSGTQAHDLSRYKQFTYAKNVIQYNIDLLNDGGRTYKPSLRYRDELTEGYNVTPNFFIYGYIDKPNDYLLNELIPNGEIVPSFHFKNRLFDRDTLFVHQYKINFLFVLKAYVTFSTDAVSKFRSEVRDTFRKEFVTYFLDSTKCGFEFYRLKTEIDSEAFINQHFKILNGKVYTTSNNEILLALSKEEEDEKIRALLKYFGKHSIS
ncbi:LlaJI restriction endonuclease [compost metagenome]